MSRLFDFGRKIIAFSKGEAALTMVSITEKSLDGENEEAFIQRLLGKYSDQQGTMEIILKNGFPDYAIITLA